MTRPWPGARYVRGVTKIADDEPVWWPRRIGREPVAARLRGRARISRQGRYYALTARQAPTRCRHSRPPHRRRLRPRPRAARAADIPGLPLDARFKDAHSDGQRVSARKEQVGSMHDERLGHPEVA